MEDKEKIVGNRLDIEVSRRGLARSRSAAADLIKRGKITLNGAVARKTSQEVYATDEIKVAGGSSFVSRAGEKLSHALTEWKIDIKGLTALDIGSSTGGFTDCLLQNGAAKVIAVDVGKDQLASALRDDSRVEVHESTDIRNFSAADFATSADSPAQAIDLAVIDVSFISLELVLSKAFELVRRGGQVIALVKPQFEVGKEIADKHKGVITDETEQKNALEKVKKFAKKTGFRIINETISPITGEKGNKEFLILLQK